ncbi:MAG TPA: hypothetical protein ENF42_03220 [Candidatus Bathyarchaeota archaeon]|nr:hypothetical protein [Candidatus Bathyarchaeota archaeon]
MDFIVYLSAYLNGFTAGMLVGVLSWLIYGTFNPLGFNVGILFACASSEVLYAVAGHITRTREVESVLDLAVGNGLSAAVSTILYDIITNISYMLIFHVKPMLALIMGLPFMAVHVISNTAIFIIATPVMILLSKT